MEWGVCKCCFQLCYCGRSRLSKRKQELRNKQLATEMLSLDLVWILGLQPMHQHEEVLAGDEEHLMHTYTHPAASLFSPFSLSLFSPILLFYLEHNPNLKLSQHS